MSVLWMMLKEMKEKVRVNKKGWKNKKGSEDKRWEKEKEKRRGSENYQRPRRRKGMLEKSSLQSKMYGIIFDIFFFVLISAEFPSSSLFVPSDELHFPFFFMVFEYLVTWDLESKISLLTAMKYFHNSFCIWHLTCSASRTNIAFLKTTVFFFREVPPQGGRWCLHMKIRRCEIDPR